MFCLSSHLAVKFTIGIPCYQSEALLRRAIESALNQDGDIEVIVVDDGSTDNSPQVALSFGSKIRFIRQDRAGAPAARNRILKEAQGDWIQYLDADDYLLPNETTRPLASLPSGIDAAYRPVWEERWIEGKPQKRRLISIDLKKDLFGQWIAWELPQTSGILWRREALQNLGGWKTDQPCCQEHELYFRALQAGLKFHYIPEPGSVYCLWSEETICRKNPVQVIQVRTQLIREMIDWLKSSRKITPAHLRIAGQVFFEMSRTWAKYNLEDAFEYFIQNRRNGLIQVRGPAAPLSYKICLALFGFRRTERLAEKYRS